jgi:secreted Zn-dependent insulinase-like peptidase
MSIQGYSEKAPVLTKQVFEQLKALTPSKEDFELYRDSL